MSVIGKGVKIAHILGVIIISTVFLYNLNVKSEAAQHHGQGALTVVEDLNQNDDDDGVVSVEENEITEDDNVEPFEPTDVWKTVKKGQKIPPGLHVRMDMKTGEKQAKLMEGSTTTTEQWDAGENIGIINTEKKRYSRDELKAALKDFKYKDETPDEKAKDDEIKKKFRSYDELKKAMQEINMSVKTEGEIVTELTEKLKTGALNTEELKPILTDLEYYLHQIDSAKIFVDLGGLESVLKLINNTNDEIRESVIYTVGAALQSNAKVQVAALDSGLMQNLLKLLAVDPSLGVKKKALFALSTLVRQFPFAQKKFLDLGGLSALSQMFTSTHEENMKIKIITLLTDMLLEHDYNKIQSTSTDHVQIERSRQYNEVKLRESMSASGWCTLMTSLLHSMSGHDSVEKVIHAMTALADTCIEDFSPAKPKLQALLTVYHQLAQDELKDGADDYYSSIYSTLQILVSQIYQTDL
ncbi:nucleotide exchange factor SIL1-like [Biomphalaria glabrata]|uniref:Nucleotide exchange factor SIL1 n=1 Tax=Biomphalaria glabrata TaxID=6526 RepID=A0A9W2Z0C4_BIOGL|nr:nucleotide exchange factor SIL1-like [Biomphalaria glabrata]XP_055868387.1 nucleotide exchange factor SIL1-like [Biomphalaria glabrata]XP_055868394.1 nucleotide exchange factor SIL1-like [Biomphalaria glabrata]XP_055868401.1 nucleotide exchange factor SIL1-like [Biomphalaria glabrata]XP_055868408.1 nucleotide exchange factor SIL1-like [Biomphalaria glabrata]XP_055868422.1 nucleotide exchange factor SIL1-like [Biomphalaria glabrata]